MFLPEPEIKANNCKSSVFAWTSTVKINSKEYKLTYNKLELPGISRQLLHHIEVGQSVHHPILVLLQASPVEISQGRIIHHSGGISQHAVTGAGRRVLVRIGLSRQHVVVVISTMKVVIRSPKASSKGHSRASIVLPVWQQQLQL